MKGRLAAYNIRTPQLYSTSVAVVFLFFLTSFFLTCSIVFMTIISTNCAW